MDSDKFPFPMPSYTGVTLDAHDYVMDYTGVHMLYLIYNHADISVDELIKKAYETYNLADVKAMSLTHLWCMGLVKIYNGRCSLTPIGKIVIEKILQHEFWSASSWPPKK